MMLLARKRLVIVFVIVLIVFTSLYDRRQRDVVAHNMALQLAWAQKSISEEKEEIDDPFDKINSSIAYPLHRTFVTSVIGERSGKQASGGVYESPLVAIGRLVDFNFSEDGIGMYTVRWESYKRKNNNMFVRGTDTKYVPESSSDNLKSTMPCDCDYGATYTEMWTESRVAIGVLLNQRMGLRIAKYFETGVFIGYVTNVFASSSKKDGEVFYHIQYEDGDSEDFDEEELQEGEALYYRIQMRQKEQDRKRKYPAKKKSILTEDTEHSLTRYATSYSFEPLYDKATPVHTLILGTHPAKVSLNENRYFAHPTNAFWWIAGDCLGFRRDRGEKRSGSGLMKLCADLRYDDSYVVPYEKQTNILCQHGFALWDIIASCQRKGSLDSAIKYDKPNDIKHFVDQNPSIKTIVLANGKSGLSVFNRHFPEWLGSGKLILHDAEVRPKTSTSNFNKDDLVKANKTNSITLICAVSVSAANTRTYKEKRDFWDEFVYTPGLKFQQQLATR